MSCLASFSGSLENIVYSKSSLIACRFFDISLRMSFEYDLLLLFRRLACILPHHASVGKLRKTHHLLLICKVRDVPFFLLLVPLWVIDNMVNLIVRHKHAEDGAKFFNLLLLFPDGVKYLLFFVLMLILDIFEFLEVGNILVLDLFEALLHFINLFIQRFIVLLYVQQLLLSFLLLNSVLLLFLLLSLQLLLELFNLLELAFILCLGNSMREVFLKTL